jgi:glycerol kinase
MVINDAGEIIARSQREFSQHYPRPGWVEHDPHDLWRSQLDTAREAIRQAGIRTDQLSAIGLTNQRETTLVWDRRTGQPIHRAIVWQDRRTADRCGRLRQQGLSELIQHRAGLVIDPYFSGTKIGWLLDHVDGARDAAERGQLCFGTVDTWLTWNLTAGRLHVTDPTNASRTLLYNLHTGQWDQQLCDALGVPMSMLPGIVPSSGVVGQADASLLGHALPIAGLAGDQQAALFGQACLSPGKAKNTYGTGCFLLLHTGTRPQPSKHRLLTTAAASVDARLAYALEGSVFIGGAVVQWLRDGLGVIESASQVESLASQVSDSDGVFVVPAFAGLGAPHWDAAARGAIVGVTRGTTKAHLARAALDAIAHQVADVLDAMTADASQPLEELRVDGGASGNNLLMQIQADLLGVPVVRPRNIETTALGAAYLAGLATGVWQDASAIDKGWAVERVFEPTMDGDERHRLRRRWTRAVDRSRDWATENG